MQVCVQYVVVYPSIKWFIVQLHSIYVWTSSCLLLILCICVMVIDSNKFDLFKRQILVVKKKSHLMSFFAVSYLYHMNHTNWPLLSNWDTKMYSCIYRISPWFVMVHEYDIYSMSFVYSIWDRKHTSWIKIIYTIANHERFSCFYHIFCKTLIFSMNIIVLSHITHLHLWKKIYKNSVKCFRIFNCILLLFFQLK